MSTDSGLLYNRVRLDKSFSMDPRSTSGDENSLIYGLGPRRCYGTRSPLKNIRARGRIIFLFFPRAARARAENKANQQYHFKSSRCCIEQLGTDSCRGTVPMEPPMPKCSMRHREPKSEIDDTGHFLQGASCIIAACCVLPTPGVCCLGRRNLILQSVKL